MSMHNRVAQAPATAAANHAACTTRGHSVMLQQLLIMQHALQGDTDSWYSKCLWCSMHYRGPRGDVTAKIHIFTESAPRPIQSGICNFHVFVCLCVCSKFLIVDCARTGKILFFCYKIDCCCIVLGILNLKTNIKIAKLVQNIHPQIFWTSYSSYLQRLKVKLINYKNKIETVSQAVSRPFPMQLHQYQNQSIKQYCHTRNAIWMPFEIYILLKIETKSILWL